MNTTTKLATLAAGIAIGMSALLLTAAACTPDPTPAPTTPAVATPVPAPMPTGSGPVPNTGPRQDYDLGELQCGVNAKPAVDQDKYGNWWAYCEPALVQK